MAEKVWADLGPTLAESPRNPNENCFTLVVDAEEYDALAARLAEVERVLRSIAANSCCGDCQEAKRVAQAYFGPADSASLCPACKTPLVAGPQRIKNGFVVSESATCPACEGRLTITSASACCDNEDRDINGGCRNCGDPCL